MTHLDAAQSIQAALQHHRAGGFAEAEKLYRQVLAAQPEQTDALHLLGVLLGQTGRTQAGIELLGRACDLCPDYAAMFLSLGNLLRDAGRPEQAIAAYVRALRLHPAGGEAHNNLGNVLIDQNRFAEAADAYRAAVRLNPKLDRAWSNLGVALRAMGQFSEAADALRRAIELDPNSSIAYDNLGIVLREIGEIDASLEAHVQSLALQPNSSAAHNNMSVTLRIKKRWDESLAACQKALALDPHNAEAFNNLGVTLAEVGRTDDAIAAYRKAIELRPGFGAAWTNLGVSLGDAGLFAQSLAACQMAVDVEPASASARFNLGVILLKLGQFERGWVEYERRWECRGLFPPNRFTQPRWDGRALSGQTVFLHADQGLGDTMQFIRYVPLIRARGGRVLFECAAPLLRLLVGFPGIETVYAQGRTPPEFDFHCPLGSLPAVFSTRAESIPVEVPYLRARPRLVNDWRGKLAPFEGQLKVGLVWAGRGAHKNDRNRSLPLARLAPLAAEGITFFSLQKGEASAQADDPPPGMRLIDFTAELFDLADSAGLIENLDLVISVDTAVAHLAGAMGKTIWTLLPVNPDWRWLLERDDSPWYPTMRLFRQGPREQWDDVVERLRGALVERAAKNPLGVA